jgi:DNA invertase Pin-like site-specific DNA recombinase
MQVIGYVRVSTQDQGRSGLGLRAQREAIKRECQRRGWTLSEVIEDRCSGKDTNRPGLTRALAMLEAGDAGGLVAAKLDRLCRSVRDFGELVEKAGAQGWSLVCLDLGMDTSTAMGAAMAQMVSVFSELERKLIGERISAALREKRRKGIKLGRKSALPAKVVERITREREGGASLQAIAHGLNRDRIRTGQGGKRWWASSVRAVLRSQAPA